MENDRRFFNICLDALQGSPIQLIKNDGTQFIWAGHLAELYVEVLASRKTNETYYGLAKNFVSWEQIARWAVEFAQAARRGKPGSRIVLKDLGWGDKPYLFNVNKIKKNFGLSFNSSNLVREHVKFLVNNPGIIPKKRS